MADGSNPLDPIDPTAIGPGLAAVPLTPTVWDDLSDWQYALTPDGIVWQRRRGLWWPAPWWQAEDAEQIKAVCAEPDEWAYASGWPRKMVEDSHGPLEPITLPGEGYPHSDDRCRQDSVDADCFREAARQVARLADALGLGDTGPSISEVVDAAIRRLDAQGGAVPAGSTNADAGRSTLPPASPGTFRHADGSECLWGIPDQKWYRMHPLYPLRECGREHVSSPEQTTAGPGDRRDDERPTGAGDGGRDE